MISIYFLYVLNALILKRCERRENVFFKIKKDNYSRKVCRIKNGKKFLFLEKLLVFNSLVCLQIILPQVFACAADKLQRPTRKQPRRQRVRFGKDFRME